MGKDNFPIPRLIVRLQPLFQHDIQIRPLEPSVAVYHLIVLAREAFFNPYAGNQTVPVRQLFRLLPCLFFRKIDRLRALHRRFPKHNRIPISPVYLIAVLLFF